MSITSRFSKSVDDLVKKIPVKDISFTVKLLTCGVFFVLIAIAYSLFLRGSVVIDVEASVTRGSDKAPAQKK